MKLFQNIFIIVFFFIIIPVQANEAQYYPIDHEKIIIIGKDNSIKISLSLELADTNEKRQIGLMFRHHMPYDHSMLFDFQTTHPITMWMKNTYIPLDIIFADHTGKIVAIAYNTTPLSEKTIASIKKVRYALEVNAGIVLEKQITIGDQLQHRFID